MIIGDGRDVMALILRYLIARQDLLSCQQWSKEI